MAGDRIEAERRLRELINDIQRAGSNGAQFYSFDTLVTAIRTYAAAVYRDTRQALALITTATDLFPSHSTRNVMIIAGAGLPLRPGADMFQYLETVKTQAEQGLLGASLRQGAARSSPMTEASSFDLTEYFRGLSAEAWRKGIAIYAVDSEMGDSSARLVESQRTVDRTASFATTANASAGYELLANETGGLAILGQRPETGLAELRSDLDNFYTIGIVPTAAVNKDTIKVHAKNYRVRVTLGGLQLSPDADISSRVVAHHLLKPDSNDLGISVQAMEPVADGEKRRVTLKVMIPIKRLKFVQEGSDVTGGFSVYIATGDQLGHASKVNKQTKQLRWPAAALQAAGDRQLTFAVDVVLEPGRNQISVGVMDDASKATGFDRVSI
jgi:hypothetical protein